MAMKRVTTTISIRVPVEVWEVWATLPEEKKELLRALFVVLVAGATKANINCSSGELVLRADEKLLRTLERVLGVSEEDECKEAVREFYKKLLKGELYLDQYSAARTVRVHLKPCFE